MVQIRLELLANFITAYPDVNSDTSLTKNRNAVTRDPSIWILKPNHNPGHASVEDCG